MFSAGKIRNQANGNLKTVQFVVLVKDYGHLAFSGEPSVYRPSDNQRYDLNDFDQVALGNPTADKFSAVLCTWPKQKSTSTAVLSAYQKARGEAAFLGTGDITVTIMNTSPTNDSTGPVEIVIALVDEDETSDMPVA